jgi:phosphate transport system permease protein
MFQTKWNPTIAYPQFGIIPLVLASVMVTLLSVLIATPLSIALAVYISEVAPQATKTRLKTLIELLSSVPTVVLGYFGILIMGPLLMGALGHVFRVDSGRMLLTCAVMMGILLIPTIANLIEDTLSNLPDHFRDGADALGLTQSESIKQVILPAAKAGIIGAFLIGMARAFGETMLLWMLSGGTVTMLNARNGGEFFKYFVGPVKGVPDTVGIELGNVSFESTHYGHLFVIGLVLFFVTFGINTLGYSIARKGQWTR